MNFVRYALACRDQIKRLPESQSRQTEAYRTITFPTHTVVVLRGSSSSRTSNRINTGIFFSWRPVNRPLNRLAGEVPLTLRSQRQSAIASVVPVLPKISSFRPSNDSFETHSPTYRPYPSTTTIGTPPTSSMIGLCLTSDLKWIRFDALPTVNTDYQECAAELFDRCATKRRGLAPFLLPNRTVRSRSLQQSDPVLARDRLVLPSSTMRT